VGLIDGRLAAGAVLAGAVTLFLVTALPRLTDRRRNGAHEAVTDGAGPTGERLRGGSGHARGRSGD
jgi:hypothetical protein